MTSIADQPPPVPNDRPAVADLVIADMHVRKALGLQRYGVPLQAHNGRDALVDAYQEAIDLAMYLRQAIEEREQPEGLTSGEPLNVPPEPHAQDAIAAQVAAVRDVMGWIVDADSEYEPAIAELAAELVDAVTRAGQAEAANDPERTAQPLDVAAIRRQAHADGYAEAIRNLCDLAGYKRWHAQQLADTGVDHHRFHATARRVLADDLEAVAEPPQLLADAVPSPMADVILPDGTHRYWSTHCRHAGPSPDDPRHADCSADRLVGNTLRDGRALPRTVEIQRKPAQCKICGAPCQCHCHKVTEPRHPVSPAPGYRPDGTPIGTLE